MQLFEIDKILCFMSDGKQSIAVVHFRLSIPETFKFIRFYFHFPFAFHSDGLLSLAEFAVICRALFRNDKGHIYAVPDDQLEQIFSVFDKNEDGFIDRDEFPFCWHHWIKTVRVLHAQFLLSTFC